jgi:hypothetical protein
MDEKELQRGLAASRQVVPVIVVSGEALALLPRLQAQ